MRGHERSTALNHFYTTKEPGKGTGLGLAICRRIIDEAGGTIEVTSRVGHRTTFTIHLPLASMVCEASPTGSVTQVVSPLELGSTAPDAKDADDGAAALMVEAIAK